MKQRILVIKLSSLGDMVMALPAFQTIRHHHGQDHITLMTTRPYAPFMEASGYFDRVIIDERPKWKNPLGWFRLARRLKAGNFNRVYDLQNADRTGLYLRLMQGQNGIVLSGTSKYATHRWSHPNRFALSIAERHHAQLALAGVDIPQSPPLPDLEWIDRLRPEAGWAGEDLPSPYALLIPGASQHRAIKRWPSDLYGHLARHLADAGLTPVVLGTALEHEAAKTIQAVAPKTVDLTSRTDFFDLVRLGRRASVAVGGDTGPLHLVAASGAPSLALISGQTNPSCLPRGPNVSLLKRDDVRTLALESVWEQVKTLAKI